MQAPSFQGKGDRQLFLSPIYNDIMRKKLPVPFSHVIGNQ